MDCGEEKDEQKKMSPCERHYHTFDRDTRNQPRVLVAMAIGLPWYQAMTALQKRRNKKAKPPQPNNKQLVRECKRRHELLGLNETKELKPGAAWNGQQLRAWLEKNPIRDQPCICFIQQKLQSTVFTEFETINPSSRVAVGVPELSTAPKRAAVSCPDYPKDKFDPRVLMARILGLPSCDFQTDPLKQQWYAPTDKILLAECKRRVTMFGSPRRAVMIKWLIDNPIQDSQECRCLLMQLCELETDMAKRQSVMERSEQTGYQQSIPDVSHHEGTRAGTTMLGESQVVDPVPEDDVDAFLNELLNSPLEDLRCATNEDANGLPTASDGYVFVVPNQCNQPKNSTEGKDDHSSSDGALSTDHLVSQAEASALKNQSRCSSQNQENLDKKNSGASVSSKAKTMASTASRLNRAKSRIACPSGTDLVTVFEVEEPVETSPSQNEVNSTSASDSLVTMSLSSFEGSRSNPSASSSSSCSNPQALTSQSSGNPISLTSLSSGEPNTSALSSSSNQRKADSSSNDDLYMASLSGSNPTTLTSSNGNSALTADSQEQVRLRGAGYSTVPREELELQVSMAGMEFDVAVNLACSVQKTDAPEDDDTLTFPSSAVVGTVPCVGGTGTTHVKVMELCDKEGRRGTYTGTCSGTQFVPLVPNGKGKMEYANGMVYNGDWQDGEWHGHGRVTYAENDFYAGALAKGFFWGHGVRHWADGSNYEGDWMLDKQSGTGTLNDSDGVWEGKWVDDKLDGFGRRTFPDGSQYDGLFVRGSQQGDYKYRDRYGQEHGGLWVTNHALPDGSRYSGLWKDEKPHGYGTCRYTNGDVYEGEYRHGVKQGYGRFMYSDGSQYEGLFVDGALGDSKSENGKKDEVVWISNHNLPDGASYDGPCQDGRANGFGKSRYQNGDVYEGHHSDDIKHGKGRFSFADGSEYVGFFVDGLEQGECTYKDRHGREHNGLWVSKLEMSAGSSYDGLWKDGVANGFGRCRYQDGGRYEGKFCGCSMHRCL